jgi:hypothetical protein
VGREATAAAVRKPSESSSGGRVDLAAAHVGEASAIAGPGDLAKLV